MIKKQRDVASSSCRQLDNFKPSTPERNRAISHKIKKVAVINDLSGFGKCSLTATIAVLSVMGVQPCPMPTAVLTNQTGFKNHYCIDLTDELHHYGEMWSANNESFDGIYSGYVASKKQVDIIADFIDKFRQSHTKVIVDPVMGDNGSLYSAYNKATCQKVRELAKTADIITPNLTELCIISDTDYKELIAKSDDKNYLEIIAETALKAISHQTQQITVTGIKKDGYIINGVISKNESYFSKSQQYGDSFSGTGDIFASIICASVVNGIDLNEAVKKATEFLEMVIADTIKEPYERNYGVNLEKFLYKLNYSD